MKNRLSIVIEINFEFDCGNPDNFRVPNVITPFDQNGINDALIITGVDFIKCPQAILKRANIINRWGDVVWTSKKAGDLWKGLNNE